MITAFLIFSAMTVQEVPHKKLPTPPPIVLTEAQRQALVEGMADLHAEIEYLEQQIIYWKLEAGKKNKDCGI